MEPVPTCPKPDLAPLYAALAKAQGAFPTIPRDRTVRVTMKSGGTYTFAYAPLDTILACVRKPLTDNGLSVTQTIRDGTVITLLGHSSGVLELAPVKIIAADGSPQGLGSALTYARRYSLQVALGIAADEDDDGVTAAGHSHTPPPTTKAAPKKNAPAPARTEKKAAPPPPDADDLSDAPAHLQDKPAHPEGTQRMSTRFQKCGQKEGKTGDRDWVRYWFQDCEGKYFATFSESVAAVARPFAESHAPVIVYYIPGDKSHDLIDVEPMEEK